MSEIENYIAPDNLPEAVKTLAQGAVTILAGGTDLTPQIDSGKRRHAPTLMNIRRIQALNNIAQEGSEIRIGCLVTVTEIRQSALLATIAPILCDAADHFASDQIRNAATIGGNICNASPAGDMIIPFLVLGASVELAHWSTDKMATRRVPLQDFFTGPGKTAARKDELLAAVIFNKPSPDFVGYFRKSGPRPALEISTVSMGLGGDFKAGKLNNVHVAMGAVGPTPLRASATEAALEGKVLNQETIQAAVTAAGKDAAPIDDIRATSWYRNHLIGVFTEELLQNVG